MDWSFPHKTFKHVIINDTYLLNKYHLEGKNLTGFLDIGANTGTTTMQYIILFRNTNVIAVEPGNPTFEKLERLVSNIGCTLVKGGIGPSNKKGLWKAAGHGFEGSILSELETGDINFYSLEHIFNIRNLGENYGIKIDCEGGEYHINNFDIIEKATYLAFEIHNRKGEEIALKEKLLKHLGNKKVISMKIIGPTEEIIAWE